MGNFNSAAKDQEIADLRNALSVAQKRNENDIYQNIVSGRHELVSPEDLERIKDKFRAELANCDSGIAKRKANLSGVDADIAERKATLTELRKDCFNHILGTYHQTVEMVMENLDGKIPEDNDLVLSWKPKFREFFNSLVEYGKVLQTWLDHDEENVDRPKPVHHFQKLFKKFEDSSWGFFYLMESHHRHLLEFVKETCTLEQARNQEARLAEVLIDSPVSINHRRSMAEHSPVGPNDQSDLDLEARFNNL